MTCTILVEIAGRGMDNGNFFPASSLDPYTRLLVCFCAGAAQPGHPPPTRPLLRSAAQVP